MVGGLFRNSVFSGLTAACTALAGFFSIVVVARLLGPEPTGIVAFTLWLVTFSVTVLDLGFHSTLARFLPEVVARQGRDYARNLISALLRPYIVICCLGCAAVAFALEISGGPTARGLVPLSIALVALQLLANIGLGCLRGLKQFELSSRLTLISALAQIAAVLMGSYFFGVPGALAGMCFGSLAVALYALPRLFAAAALPDKTYVRRLVRFAAYTWLANIAALFVWNRAELLFLEQSWGAHAVGLYSVGLTFANLATQGPMLLSGALLAFFSERVAIDAMDSVQDGLATGTRMMAFLAFPLGFGSAAILPALLPLIYGQAFAPAVVPATILVLSATIGAPGVVGTNMLYARDRSDFVFVCTLIGAALFVLIGFLVVPTFGMLGAAVGRLGVQVTMVAMGCIFIVKTLGCAIPFGDLARLLASAVACGAAARLCILLLSGWIAIPTAIVAGAMTYVLMVRVLHALPASDTERLLAVGARFPSPVRWLPTGALRILTPTGGSRG